MYLDEQWISVFFHGFGGKYDYGKDAFVQQIKVCFEFDFFN